MPEETHVLDLLPAYVLGSLESGETRAVEAHLSGCVICRAESNAFREVADSMGVLAPPVAPPPALRDRLMQRIGSLKPSEAIPPRLPSRPWLEGFLPVWGMASLFLVLVLSGLNFFLWQRLGRIEPNTTPGGMRAVALVPSDGSSQATGFIIVGADGRNGALVVDRLPPLDEDRKYQLWLVRDGQRTSGALFSTDDQSYGGTRVRSPRPLFEYSSAEITIEPADGSPQPTGSLVLGAPLFSP